MDIQMSEWALLMEGTELNKVPSIYCEDFSRIVLDFDAWLALIVDV